MDQTAPIADLISPSTTAKITVLNVQPVKGGKLFALASVEIDIDGVVIVVHGVQALRCEPERDAIVRGNRCISP